MDRRLRLLVHALGALVVLAGALDVLRWREVPLGVATAVLGLTLAAAATAARRSPNGARLGAMALSAAVALLEGIRLAIHRSTPSAVPVAAMALVLVVLLRVPSGPRGTGDSRGAPR